MATVGGGPDDGAVVGPRSGPSARGRRRSPSARCQDRVRKKRPPLFFVEQVGGAGVVEGSYEADM